MLEYVSQNKKDILDIFGEYLVRDNLDKIIDYNSKGRFKLQEFLGICNIEYIAPLDATKTSIEDKFVDFYISYTVFEHISESDLVSLIIEGNRILKDDGLHVHRVDYSDHFSHSDKSISSINFLQFTDDVWAKYADNKYMYMNRLRHDDFRGLFNSTGCHIITEIQDKNRRVSNLLLENNFVLDEKFKNKKNEILETEAAWFVLRKS